MVFYGLHYAVLKSRVVHYSVEFQLFMYVRRNHHGYTFDGASSRYEVIITSMVRKVQDCQRMLDSLQFYSYAENATKLA